MLRARTLVANTEDGNEASVGVDHDDEKMMGRDEASKQRVK